ncbi:MAG TPA: hypothetical protein VLM79_06020 [Kofleriaceae bacterium]|nr:hypothetical protein [Kofleriaceae bacterium]
MAGDLEFIPLGDADPETGDVLELAIANPDYAQELAAHRDVLQRNPFAQNAAVETLTPRLSNRGEDLIGADELCVACPRVTLVVGYPFSRQYAVTVDASSPSGFTRADLFRQLVRVYSAMYEGATFSPGKPKLQTRVDSPRFGTAWHRLDELTIEQVVLQKRSDGKAFAWISIGS